MPKRQSKPKPPFSQLPRHKRGDAVISLKHKIDREAAEYGGSFTSRLILEEQESSDFNQQWFDFYFLGSDRFTLWNASFSTARKEFWREVQDIAFKRISAMITLEELRMCTRLSFEPETRSSTGKILSYKLSERANPRLDALGGMTFKEKLRQLEDEIARHEPIAVHESFKANKNYAYGVGLEIVLNVDRVNRRTIEAAIEQFRALGEKDWTAPSPIPRDQLPFISEREAWENFRASEQKKRQA